MRKLISLITLFSFSIQAATITDDKLTVGKKASASAKEIVFDTNDGANNKKLSVDKITKKLSATSDEVIVGDGTQSDKALTFNRGGSNAQVKWNELTDKLQFSNDGTTFKDLGTGGGGGGSTGVNVLTNDSFEDAVGGVLTDWSNTGGTLTQQTYTNSVEGDAKYFQFVATGAGQYFEMVKTVPTNFNGQGCQVDFKKMNIATADLFKVEALDASNNVLATGNVKVSSWKKFPTLSFACPSAGSTFKIRVTSLAAGTLQGDKAYLGSNQNLVYSSQAKLIGTMTVNNCAAGWTTSSTTLAAFPAQTGCTYSTTGSLLAPLTNIPAFRVARLEAGDYWIEYQGSFNQSTASKSGWVRFTDGTNIARETSAVYSAGGLISVPGVSQSISYGTAQSNVLMELRGYTESGGSTTVFGVVTTPAVFKLWYFPSSSEVAVSNEQSSWFIDANIGGANPSMGTVPITSYTYITDPSLDLIVNSNKGSANANIACAVGTASTGTTCTAANESIGITFTPPSSGLYEACFSFSDQLSSSSSVVATYQLIETSDIASTILQEGNTRVSSGGVIAVSRANVTTNKICGEFNFPDSSKRTIRLAYELSGAIAGADIFADRSATNGQRDIHITVRPLLSAYNRPILTGDQVTVPGSTKMVTKLAIIGTANCSALTFYGSPWLTYVSGATIGGGCSYTMSGFSARPICKGMTENQNSLLSHGSTTVTATSVQFRTLNSNTFANVDTVTSIECTGPSN